MEDAFRTLIAVAGAVSLFTFLAVATWAENRRKEREAYYQSETLRKAMEQGTDASQSVLTMIREEELRQVRRRIEGLKLGGLITGVVGLGAMIFLYFIVPDEPVWLAGLIPLLIGFVLTVYAFTYRLEPSPRK